MWEIVLFNLRVMSSFLADYSPLAFYLTVTLAFSSVFSSIFRVWTYQGRVVEIAKPRAIIKLIECVHLHRHEENLKAEEECYYLLVEIVRSPELVRAMSGSRVRGSAAPELDGLNKK